MNAVVCLQKGAVSSRKIRKQVMSANKEKKKDNLQIMSSSPLSSEKLKAGRGFYSLVNVMVTINIQFSACSES